MIKDMRNWIRDCVWTESDCDPDFVDSLTDDEVKAGIDKHYDGGLDGFYRDAGAGSGYPDWMK